MSTLCQLTIGTVSVCLLIRDLVDLVDEVDHCRQLTDHNVYFGELNQLWMVRHQKFFFQIRIFEFESEFVLFVRLPHFLQKLMQAD